VHLSHKVDKLTPSFKDYFRKTEKKMMIVVEDRLEEEERREEDEGWCSFRSLCWILLHIGALIAEFLWIRFLAQ
jgi:hypothetical protein